MKVLLINGSPHEYGCIYTSLSEVKKSLEANGVEGEIFWLGSQAIQDCTGCNACSRLGRCMYDDCVNEVYDRLDEFQGIVVGSPVYYAGPSARVQCFLDRLFYISGKKKLAGKCAAAVVNCRRGGASAAFDRLNKYFTICNMPVVSSQYWNSTHGYTPEDVAKDLEGLQTMRTLGQNMAWMITNTAGKETPCYEKIQITNFIQDKE